MQQPQDSIQASLLELVRKKLPPNLSLADELADTLNISRDSAYRRIRGETVLSLDEVKVICTTYQVSLDGLINKTENSSGTITGKNSTDEPAQDVR